MVAPTKSKLRRGTNTGGFRVEVSPCFVFNDVTILSLWIEDP